MIVRKAFLFVLLFTAGVYAGLLWFGSEIRHQFLQLEEGWASNVEITSQRSFSLSQIQSNFGYGGFIHHFKNLVLRKDVTLIPIISASLDQTYQSLDNYNAYAGANREAAEQLRLTVDQYAERFHVAVELIKQGASAEIIDRRVSVDDTAARSALQAMMEQELAVTDAEKQRLKAGINHHLKVLMVGAVIVLAAISLNIWLVLLVRNRKSSNIEARLMLVQDILQLMPDAMVVVGQKGSIEYTNASAEKLLGYSGKELKNKSIESIIPQRYRHDHVALRDGFAKHTQAREKSRDVMALTASGCEVPVAVSLNQIVIPGEKLTVACLRDVSERRKREENLQMRADQYYKLAHRDPLTEVANRRYFEEYLERVSEQVRSSNAPLTLLMIDIDKFKEYNDQYGHPQGDRCLKQVADKLQRAAQRSGDVVARYGGEEFACILPNTGASEAESIVNRIMLGIRALNTPHEMSSVEPHVTISIGGCTIMDGRVENIQDLIDEADRQLYKAKDEGRNCYRLMQV